MNTIRTCCFIKLESSQFLCYLCPTKSWKLNVITRTNMILQPVIFFFLTYCPQFVILSQTCNLFYLLASHSLVKTFIQRISNATSPVARNYFFRKDVSQFWQILHNILSGTAKRITDGLLWTFCWNWMAQIENCVAGHIWLKSWEICIYVLELISVVKCLAECAYGVP